MFSGLSYQEGLSFFSGLVSRHFVGTGKAARRRLATFLLSCGVFASPFGISANVNPDGSFSHNIPIEIPQGRNGIQPQLALTYNSNSGNGIVGVGWSLQGIPVITRMNFGRGINYDGQDTYVGPEGRLIMVPGASTPLGNPPIYHAENETWSKYEPLGSDDQVLHSGNKCAGSTVSAVEPCAWRVTDRSGVVYLYGANGQSRSVAIDAAGNSLYSGAVRQWALTRVTDLNGNYYEVEYDKNAGQIYPKRIRYTYGPGASKHYTITFAYDESNRPDKEISYASSSFVQTNWRLKEVLVEAEQPIWWIFSWTVQVRRYVVGYENLAGLYLSRVTSWQEFDSANSPKPQLALTWSQGDPSYGASGSTSSSSVGWAGSNSSAYRFLDINGDGKTDMIFLGDDNKQYVVLNTGSGFGGTTSVSSVGWGPASAYQFADVDGDTLPDMIFLGDDNRQYVVRNNGSGFPSGSSSISSVGWGGSNPNAYRFLDVDGDGKADMIFISETGQQNVVLNSGTGFPSSSSSVSHVGWGPSSAYQFADLNGDGLPDMVYFGDDNVQRVVLNTGSGFPSSASSSSTVGWGPASAYQLVDVNSDGRSDLIFLGNDHKQYVVLNQGSGFASGSSSISAVGWGGSDSSAYQFMDFDGDRRPDMVFLGGDGKQYIVKNTGSGYPSGTFSVSEHGSGSASGYIFTDVNGDSLPDMIFLAGDSRQYLKLYPGGLGNLLVRFTAGTGQVTDIEYRPAPQLPKTICTTPCTGPQGETLSTAHGIANSAPRYLVTSVTTTSDRDLDGNGVNDSFTTSYEYYNGRVSTGTIAERASLGFEKIKTTDVNSGNYSITTYRQDKPFHKSLSSSRNYLADNTLVSEEIAATPELWLCNESGCNHDLSNNPNPTQPTQIRQSGTKLSRQYQAGVLVATKEEQIAQYDNYGNPLVVRQAIIAGGSSRETYKFVQYINEVNSTRAIGLPVSEITCATAVVCTAGDANYFGAFRIYYDEQALGGIGTRHLPTRKETYLWPSGGDGSWTAENFTYDSSGNVLTKLDAMGMLTTTVYDSDYNQFPISVSRTRNGKTIGFTATYDPRFGKKISETTEDGKTTTISLDATGFATEITTQNGTTVISKKTATHSTVGTTPIWAESCSHYGPGFLLKTCTKQFNDALGRPYREEFPLLVNDVETQMAIERQFNNRNQEIKVSEPFNAVSGTPTQWNAKTYDVYGRATSTLSFDGKTTQTEYQFAGLPTGMVSCIVHTGTDGKRQRTCNGLSGKPGIINENYGSGAETTTQYTYDNRNRLISAQVPQGIISIGYLGQSNLQTFIDDPAAGRIDYDYFTNPAEITFGKLKKETRPHPNNPTGTIESHFEYEPTWGRLSKQTKSDGSTVEYFYDETDVMFGKDHLTSIKSISRGYTLTDRFSYSPAGYVATTTRRISHTTLQLCATADDFPCLSVTGNRIDELGRTVEMTYSDNLKSSFSYIGGTKNLQSITHNDVNYATYAGYNIYGKPATLTYGNGAVTNFAYDAAGFLNSYSVASGQNTLLDYQYTFDNAHNITAMTNNVFSDFSVNYTYDSLNRLKTAQRGSKPAQNFAFDQTGVNGQTQGNLLEKKGRRMVYSTRNRPLSDEIYNQQTLSWESFQSLYWSAAGNLTSRISPNGSASYAYDADNMMKESHDPTTGDAEYFYDYSGERFLKIFKKSGEAAIKTWTVNDGIELREKWSPDLTTKHGAQTTKYIYGIDNKRLATVTGAPVLLAAQISGNYYALAQMHSANSLAGLGAKITYTFYGFVHDETTHRKMLLCLLLVSIGGLSFYLIRGWSKSAMRNGEDFSFRRPFALASALIFISVNINCGVGTNSTDKNNAYYAGYSVGWLGAYDGLPAGTYYYHNTHIDTANLITDASGNEVLRLSYDDYGNIDQFNSGKLNPQTGELDTADENIEYLVTGIKFGSNAFDPETGFYFMHARYYMPEVGVFTTADDFVPGATPELRTSKAYNHRENQAGYQKQLGQQGGSQSFNRYMYTVGNPVKYSDPTGHAPYTDEPDDWDCFTNPLRCTSPWWHNFTGPTNRADAKGPVEGVSMLDDFSKAHDAAGAKICIGGGCSEEERQKTIIADMTWVVGTGINILSGANTGGNIRKAFQSKWYKQVTYDLSKFIERDPWIAPFAGVIYVVASLAAIGAGLFNSVVDTMIVYPMGQVLFAINILYSTVIENPGGTAIGMGIGQALFGGVGAIAGALIGGAVGKPSFKNWDKPSEWKLPEGEGRLKNYNRPSEWKITKKDWEDAGKTARCVFTLGLWC